MDNSRIFLKSIFTEHWKYMAIASACKIGLFDCLYVGALSCNEISCALNLNKKALQFLLSALCNAKFLSVKNENYQLTELSELLTECHPETLKYACLNWSGEHLNAWQDLPQVLANGKSYFENNLGTGFFDYLCKSPKKLHHYHLAMSEYAKDDYKELPQLIDWLQHKSIMDVGGGYGACIDLMQKHYPQINCYLFDLPDVVNQVVNSCIKKIGGNFFEPLPRIAEAIIVSRVIHDWSNDKALIILKNCYNALPTSGVLYLIENCSDLIDIDLSLLSLNMLVMCESHERTSEQYKLLCQNVNFIFETQIKLNALQTILIFRK